MASGEEKPHIIIDEDWKSQAQAEKEKLLKQREQDTGQSKPSQPAARGALPEASLAMLLSTLATQAMVCLGQIPNPLTGQAEVSLEEAKHFIDTIKMLEDKTQGNRTPQEIAMFSRLLHELRMTYVSVQANPPMPETPSPDK